MLSYYISVPVRDPCPLPWPDFNRVSGHVLRFIGENDVDTAEFCRKVMHVEVSSGKNVLRSRKN